ncbi:CHAT domain-containing protein [Dactylosporangium sp. CA-139066]|uniref:CHAT domain-containing protein n=1 Tax=Dactylosporangium sp. CA-139066 TaxID=3239930 RepID=UPI003D917932
MDGPDRDVSPRPSGTAVLSAAGPDGVSAWVALQVEPVAGRVSGEGSDAQRRAEAALADAGWLAGQWDPAGGARLELRYLHQPGEGVRCVLLGRVVAPTSGAATAAALRLRDRLGMLPPHVRAAPVEAPDAVQRLLNPFPAHPSGVVEVRKQVRLGVPSRPDAGVAYYLAVPRFAAGAANWGPLWQAVADLPQPFMLSVGLEPFAPAAPFVGLLAELAAKYGRLATPGRTVQGQLSGRSYELAADPFAVYAARLFDDAWRHYQSGVFRTRITLASPAPLPPALVEQVAATICAPRDDREVTHVLVAPEPDELSTAWRNVTTLEHARWDRRYLGRLPIPVPPGLRLLAETVDAREAASGWRLPPAPPAGGRRVFVSVTTHVAGDYITNTGDHATIVNRSTVPGPTDAAGQAPALRILLVCANPRGSEPLRTAEEDRTLRQSIRMSAERDRIAIETLNAATVDDLRRALLRDPFDIVHFSGHGTHQGLVFEDDAGHRFTPSSDALAELFARRKIRVAVLNACYSLSLGRISAIGTEFTIAADGPLSDPAAIEFTRGFYDALGAGLDVPDAFDEGKGTAALKGLTFDAILLRRGEEHVGPRV